VKFGVSIYIPNRNHAATLGAAIYSAACQSPVEVGVIDDASTDDSVAVADAAKMTHDCVWVQHNAEKAKCWEQKAAEEFELFGGSHVVGLSADDELVPGIVQSVMRHPQAAVIFHDYYCRRPGKWPHAIVRCAEPSQQVTLPALFVRERLLGDGMPVETGIGSAIRHDWLKRLCELEYWRMGPWADAIGYAVVAALGGAVYVPQPGAIFTEDDAGYGEKSRTGPDASRYMVEVWAFLKRAEVPPDVAAALCRKRGVHA
jgi:glycosyltransferase involved in cell wall biosynthesis